MPNGSLILNLSFRLNVPLSRVQGQRVNKGVRSTLIDLQSVIAQTDIAIPGTISQQSSAHSIFRFSYMCLFIIALGGLAS